MRKRGSSTGATSGSFGSRSRASLGTWLPSRGSYAAAEGVTLAALVTYDVMGAEKTKLPRPAPIVATMVFYALLAAVGSVSRSFEPVVTGVAWLITLTVLVTGRRGAGILGVLSKITGYVSNLGGDSTTAAPAPAAAP